MNIFPAHATDFYKTGHIKQYPSGTTGVYSNFTPRSGKWAAGRVLSDWDNKVVFFGLQAVCQYLLIEEWDRNFFDRRLPHILDKYKRRMDSSLGPNAVSTDHIKALWELGHLPLEIKALPEGSRVNIGVPLWTIKNTLPEFYWLTNYVETQLSSELFGMLNSATLAYEYRRLFNRYAEMTGSPLDFTPWQGHDFSFRGIAGIHAATASGAAHLMSFTGTDTITAIDFLEEYYPGEGLIGGSVPATEHSVMCMGGLDDEINTFRRLVTEVYPAGIVSIVSDTWDFWQVLTEYTVTLKEQILAREGKVVFRPDSGDPVKIIIGDPASTPGSPEYKGAVECLWDVFGGTITDKGYRLLDQHVGLIYGDSITLERATAILEGLEKKGFASTNIVFGIGSFTYQPNTRDTFGTAIKATFGEVNGESRELFKAPKTDDGLKKSARGLLRVEFENGKFILYDRQTAEQEQQGLLKTVFKDSKMVRVQSYNGIRELLWPTPKKENDGSTTA
jgi:nicotinamide phosphoribosyltransferase